MKKPTMGQSAVISAILGASAVGCGASDGSHGADGTETQRAPLSIAERFVALNAQADTQMHLVARKYLNNDTEVAMFHEPIAGHIMFSAAGSPLGPSVLSRSLVEGKTASELWALVAPGEPFPATLAAAIERSKNPAPLPQATTTSRVANEVAAGPRFGAPAPEAQATGETLLSGGYCVSQFWSDWGNIGNVGADLRTSSVFNYGWYDQPYSNVSGESQFAACPLGNVSNKGGWLMMSFPDGTRPQYNLPPDYYYVVGWIAGYDCGFDLRCIPLGGTQNCTPQGFHIEGRFDSQCFLDQGTSCGDNFDWISYANTGLDYCK